MSRRGLHRIEHFVEAQRQVLRDLQHRGLSAVLKGEAVSGVFDRQGQLLGFARDVHTPPVVSEVAFELTDDRGHRERAEVVAKLGPEAVNRLDQAQRRYLQKIVKRLTGAAVAARQLTSQGQMAPHELIASPPVSVSVPPFEQRMSAEPAQIL